MDYAALNPAERRALNIQRQEAFFRENHGHRAETLVDEGREEKVSEEIVFSEEGSKVDSSIASSSLASLVCRESEVSQIHSFIQRDYGLHDVLLVTAASGTGKTRLIQHALQICKGVAHAYVLCSGFSAPKQLVRCVWMAIESLAAREGSAAAHSYPSSYEDLVKNASSMRFSSTAVLVLDRIDCADDLLPGLSEKLMLLPEHAENTRLKIIGAACRPICVAMRVHYLRLKPFSDQQLKEITLHQISLYDSLHQESLAVLAKRELLSILTITRHCGEIWNALLAIYGYAEAEAPAKQAKIESARTQRAQSLVTRFLQQKGLKETSYDSVPRSTCTRMSFESRGAALDDWTSAFPQVSKCVLLAAFCAACNSKKTDAFTFGAERRGKRRRQYAGSAHISAENEASDNMTGGNVFSLERLAAIFIQICAATSAVFSGVRSEDAAKVLRRRRHASQREALSEVEEFFGDLYFLSAVKCLTERRLLRRAGAFRLSDPSFTCNLSDAMAQDLARSVQFDISAYLQ